MMMMMMAKSLFAILALVGRTSAFQTAQPNMTPLRTAPSYSTALHMANDEDFMRWAKSSRSAQADDTVVELMKPLGLVLNADDEGNVYVETVAPKGNAARTGKVSVHYIVIAQELACVLHSFVSSFYLYSNCTIIQPGILSCLISHLI
jgi:hypothetical protein